MNKNLTFKTLILSAAAALSLGATARAGGLEESMPANGAMGQGLLGQNYATLTYSYLDLDGPVNADNYQFAFNTPLNTGFDGVLAYDFTQAGLFAGNRERTQSLTASLRAFTTTAWAKPYAEAGIGYAWQRGTPSGSDNSLILQVAVGAEFQVRPAFTVTPYLQYTDAPDLRGSDSWKLGAKANYWVDSQWAVTAGFARDDNHTNTFTIGTNFRF